MSIEGKERNIYEVYDRKTGRLLANGTVGSCARKLQITQSGFRLAAEKPNHSKYIIRHVATIRRIFSVYDDKAGLISRGSAQQVANEMGRNKSTVEYWGRMGYSKGLTITLTEEMEPTEEAREDMHPCTICGKDCEDGSECKLWRAWWVKTYDRTREDIRKAAGG